MRGVRDRLSLLSPEYMLYSRAEGWLNVRYRGIEGPGWRPLQPLVTHRVFRGGIRRVSTRQSWLLVRPSRQGLRGVEICARFVPLERVEKYLQTVRRSFLTIGRHKPPRCIGSLTPKIAREKRIHYLKHGSARRTETGSGPSIKGQRYSVSLTGGVCRLPCASHTTLR